LALDATLVEALTPDFPPPMEMEDPGETDGSGRHRWEWSQFLLRGGFADRVLHAARRVPQSWYAGVGLVPWNEVELDLRVAAKLEDAARKSGYVWGGVVLTSLPTAPHVYDGRSGVLSFVERRFPILVRYAGYQPEAMRVENGNRGLLGTATSWARASVTNRSFPGLEGCVTAAHVVAAQRAGLAIQHDLGLTWPAAVRAFAPPCMDAAFISLSWPTPAPGPFRPQLPSAIAFGDPAGFDGAVTRWVAGFVTHVSAHAGYSGSGVPMILCHDGLGAQGDSGSRVDVRGMPTGMHLGKITLDAGGEESRAVFLHQIAHVMQLEFCW
jgi:hypothetical protein